MESKPQRCKSRECCRSKASEGEAVVYYRKPLATKDMRYARLSRRVKNMPILLRFWNSLGVDSRYLSQISLKLYDSCLLCHFGMFFMQLWGKEWRFNSDGFGLGEGIAAQGGTGMASGKWVKAGILTQIMVKTAPVDVPNNYSCNLF